MSWIRIWVHVVWSTRDRYPFLTDEIRTSVFQHIRENAKTKAIYIDFINGFVDHVHCLISLGPGQEIDKVVQLLKGESSFWINQNKLTKTKFGWQDEYFAVSVSPSGLDSVRRYIANQEVHHRTVSFADEFDHFIERAGFGKGAKN